MAVELSQLGESRYLLQDKGRFALPPREIELQNIDQARALAAERERVGKDLGKAGIITTALGLVPIAMVLSGHFVPEIHGFHNPLFNQPRVASLGEAITGLTMESIAGALGFASMRVRRNARQINTAVKNFTPKAQ